MRFGVQYSPAQVAVELEEENGSWTLVRFRIRDPLAESSQNVARELQRRLEERTDALLTAKQRRMLTDCTQHLRDRAEAEMAVADRRDLNAVSPAVLEHAKRIMDSDFQKKALQRGDPGFVYDVKKTFEAADSDNSWDEDDEQGEE